MNYHKFNGKINIISELISNERQKQKLSYQDLSNKLQLIGVCLYKNDLFLIENNRRMVRDFELVALFKVLNIDIENFNNLFEEFN